MNDIYYGKYKKYKQKYLEFKKQSGGKTFVSDKKNNSMINNLYITSDE